MFQARISYMPLDHWTGAYLSCTTWALVSVVSKKNIGVHMCDEIFSYSFAMLRTYSIHHVRTTYSQLGVLIVTPLRAIHTSTPMNRSYSPVDLEHA